MRKLLSANILLGLAIFFASCTKEPGLDECYGALKLKFSFTLHTESGDQFVQHVDALRVYFFDQSGVLCHVEQAKGEQITEQYLMEVTIAPGKYKILAWAGSSADLNRSYQEQSPVEVGPGGQNDGFVIGKTTIDQFYLHLKTQSTGSPNAVTPHDTQFDDLFYGAVGTRDQLSSFYNMEQVEVLSDRAVERTIDMIRNTNVINLTITGTDYIAPNSNFTVWISSANADYSTLDNRILPDAKTILYTPYATSTTLSTFTADLKIQRIMESKQPSTVMLYILTPDGAHLMPPIDLTERLLKIVDPQTGNIYNSQSDFDRIYNHPVRIHIGADLKITIYIHNWEVVTVEPA